MSFQTPSESARPSTRTASWSTSKRRAFLTTGVLGALSTIGCVDRLDGGGNDESSDGIARFEVETVAELTRPWAIDFLPDDPRLLVTERGGRLVLVDPGDGTLEPTDGTPEVFDSGQGGLLDVAVHPAFPEEPHVYLTYAATNEAGASATHLGRGRLDRDAATIETFDPIHVAEPYVDSNGHYGSRIVFGQDGMLYVTTGDRQFKDFGPDHVAQDLSSELGATLRLEPDGSTPSDNPFVDDPTAVDSIYSYGHRNSQGMAVQPATGAIWQSEHGEEDGDELNVVHAGGNYGWPIATEACRYGTSDPVGVSHDERDDVVDPVHYWACNSGGFPPAGMTFYEGEAFPEWRGDLFVGNLAGRYLGHFSVDGTTVTELDPLLVDLGWRIRDVAVDPATGYLYVAVDAVEGEIVRIVPS